MLSHETGQFSFVSSNLESVIRIAVNICRILVLVTLTDEPKISCYLT